MAKTLDDCDRCADSFYCDTSKLDRCNVAEEKTSVIDDSNCQSMYGTGYLLDTHSKIKNLNHNGEL